MGKIKQQPITSRADDRTIFFYHAFRNILLVSLPLVLISALLLSLPHSSATISDSSSDSLSISISSACTLSSSVDSTHTVPVNAGSYTSDIGNTKINAYCNDNNGYSIYAIGNSGDTDGNTDLISNINDNYNIHTGIYDSSSITASSPSSWSMKLTAGVGSGVNTTPPTINNNYNNYSIVPNTYTLVASRASKTDMTIDTSVTGSYFTTTYDIYASSLQPAGTYTGKVKYLMVHPQSNNQHFGFNEVFAANGKGAINVDGNSYYAMQDMTSDICSKVGLLNEASQTQLVDIRDNKLYWVAKLDDGHCWMTQNLDFDIAVDSQDPTKMKTLTSEDTDLTDHSLTGAYANGYSYDSATGVTTWTPSSTAKTIDFEGTTVNSWNFSATAPYSASKTDGTNTGHASLGNYYNWTATIASNDSSSLANNNTDNSICPKSWRLPTKNNFGTLNDLYNNGSTTDDTGLVAAPLWFVKSGLTSELTLYGFSTVGVYWSNTTDSLRFDDNSVKITTNYAKNRTFSIRCLVR